MCLISRVHDWGREIDHAKWTPEALTNFKKLLPAINQLDTQLGEPDCEDPTKSEWLRSMEQRFAEAEGLAAP